MTKVEERLKLAHQRAQEQDRQLAEFTARIAGGEKASQASITALREAASASRQNSTATEDIQLPGTEQTGTTNGFATQRKLELAARKAAMEDRKRDTLDDREKQQKALETALNELYQQMESYKNNGQQDKLQAAEQKYAQLDQQLDEVNEAISVYESAKDRGDFTAGGGFGTNEENHAAKQPWYKTAFDVMGAGAGHFNQGIASTADFLANAIPRVEGAVFGTDPEGTFTGQILKPVTDATGKLVDWVNENTGNLEQQISVDTADSKAAQVAAELGSATVSALPNAVLAMLSGGASVGGELAAQSTGLSSTIANAATKVLKNPMFQMSAIQSLGSGYDEAKEAGASDTAAMSTAVISSLLNALVEVGGGVETLPGELQNVDLSTSQKVLEWVKSALDEGKEEVIQGVISTLANNVAGDSGTQIFSTTDENALVNPTRMAQEFGGGAAVGGILGGGQLLGNTLANRVARGYTQEATPQSAAQTAPLTQGSLDGGQGSGRPTAGNVDVEQAVTDTYNQSPVSGNAQQQAKVAQAVADMMGQPNTNKLNIDNTNQQSYTENRSTGGASNGTELDENSGTGVWERSYGGATDPALAGRLSPDGRGNLSDTGIVLLSPESQRTLTERGIVNVELHDSSADNAAFSSALDAARAVDSKNGWAVTPKTAEELTQAETKSYMDKNGSTGFAIAPDGDIEAVFANKAAGAPKGSTKSTIPQAIALGGNKLDCYGRNLVDIYAQYGFEPVARVKFNAEYANPGWTADKGSPDIYFMVHNGDSADAVVQKMGNYKIWSNADLEALPVMEYDEAYEYRDILLNRRNGEPITVDDVMPKVKDSVGDMGAKTSDFAHEVKESKSKTTPDYYERYNIPEEGRADNHYTAVTERESLHNAKLRLEQDYEGEVAEMRDKPTWTNEEMDMSQLVLDDLRNEAKKSGDWTKFREWTKVDQDHKSETGRSLQSLKKQKRQNGTAIIEAAADILNENTDSHVDTDDILDSVAYLADKFDFAVQTMDVDALVQLIKDTATERKTGYKQTRRGQKQSKYLNWALDRIANFAKSGDVDSNLDPNLEITAANIEQPDVAFRYLQDFASTGILNIAADANGSSFGKKVMTVRRMGLLSKTATTMRNLVANGAFDLVDTVARDISVPLDALFSTVTGTRSVAMDYGYFSKAKRQGTLDGIAMASLEVSLDVNGRDNSGKYGPSGNRTFKMSDGIVSKFFSTLEAVQGYALNVTDEASKGGTAAEVQRGLDRLYEKGKIKATDDSLRAGGQQEALYRTFQDETVLSNVTQGIRKGLNEAHLGDVGLGDTLMPFAQVPANLADRAIDYSPAGLAKSTGKLVQALTKAKKGEFTAADQAKVVQSLGRNITGTGLIALSTLLSLKGLIRVLNPGGDDENKDQSAFEKMQGQSGTQWNLSATMRAISGQSTDWRDDDILMSIAFLEPINANMTIGALLAEDIEAEGGLTAKTLMRDSFSGSLASLLDMPFMDTFGDIADAYNYSSESRVGDKVLDAGKTLAANEIASLIPNAAKGIAQGLDPYQRDLYSKDDTWGQLGDQFRAVFDRDSLPIKQDSFGNDMKNDEPGLNFLNNNILPGWISTYNTSDLMDEINRIAKETGSASVYPTRQAPEKLTIDSQSYPLSQEQQRQYQSVYGQNEQEVRTELMNTDTYDNLTAEQQKLAHSYAETYSKQIAGNTVNSDYEMSEWVEEARDKSPEEIAEAVIAQTIQNLASKNEGGKYAGLSDFLESGTIEDQVAISLLSKDYFEKWESYGEKYKIPVGTLMDALGYYNSDESKTLKNKKGEDIKGETKKDHMKKWMLEQDLTSAQRRGLWCMFYEESTYPW